MGKNIQFKVGVLIVAVLLALIFVMSLAGCDRQSAGQSEESTAAFCPDRVVSVRFVMTEENWTSLRENARDEDYVKTDMWYDGELVPDIAVRPKGNSSLATAISTGSIRFSFKADLNFFNSARNLDGVKKLNFNNGFSDPTFMREILSYELFAQMGIPTPRTAFVDLWINDTHMGLYTMVEQIDQTFLRRYFTDANGNLYKPEMPAGYLNWTEADVAEILSSQDDTGGSLDVNIGGGKLSEILEALGWEFATIEESVVPGVPQMIPGGGGFGNLPAGNFTQRRPGLGNLPADIPIPGGNPPENLPQMGAALPGGGLPQAGGMIMGGRGNLLEQMGLKTNENNPNYSALFRLLEVLNNEPDETFVEEIEKVLDVDQVLRFLAVSTTLVHLDNYIGMGHNYYLYEVDGKFTIIPWDLNMSFGGFNTGLDSNSAINYLIDEPTNGAVADRPLVAKLLAVPEYLEIYHGILTDLTNRPSS